MRIVLLAIYFIALGVGYADACADGDKVVREQMAVEFLKGHNKARRAVKVQPLVWNKGLAEVAENWARKLAQKCDGLVHSKNPYGENIAAAWGGAPRSGVDVSNMWIKEKQWYNYRTNSCQTGKVCGHYTQVVWKRSTEVGCGKASCTMDSGAKKTYWVCNYNPPGNYRGQRPY